MAAFKILNKKQFALYKKSVLKAVEEKRTAGKDYWYLTTFIINYISHSRFAFTGKQIKELLKLAD